MNTRFALIVCLLVLLACAAACKPNSAPSTPAEPPFPTMTPGRFLIAPLPPPANADDPGLSNPATAIALVSQPTPTPNLSVCPTPNESLTLPADPPAASLLDTTLVDFLSDGGTLVALESSLRAWGMITGEAGGTRGDIDLTGEGVPEIILRYAANGEGVLLIVGCIDGHMIDRYRASYGAGVPEIISYADANANGVPDLLFAAQVCDAEGTCQYRAQMVTWQPERGRFVNLISDPLINDTPPTLEDIDNDRVGEIIARQNSPGDETTGPLRTGYTAWDWDGQSYVRAVTRLDPPRFRVQAVQEADTDFRAEQYQDSIPLYQQAADDPALENWLPDDDVTLKAYALFRLLVVYSYEEDARRVEIQGRLLSEYPDPAAAPPYVQMGLEFWNALQVTNNMHAACGKALEVAANRLDAVGLLNRYGTRAPFFYDTTSLCPF